MLTASRNIKPQREITKPARRTKQLKHIHKKLIDINYHIYGSPKYLEKFGYPKTINDLNKHQFISFGKGAPSPVFNPDCALKLGMKDNKKIIEAINT